MRIDWLCAAALMINGAELLVLVTFYWPLLCAVPFAVVLRDAALVDLRSYDDSYVSDLLHSNAAYSALLTCLVAMHLGVCSVFVLRLNRAVPAERPLLILELFFLVAAWAGWVLLNHIYLGADGRMLAGHMVGAGMFIFSSSIYFGCMAWNVAVLGKGPWSCMEVGLFSLMAFCFFVSAGAGAVFVASVFDHRIPLAWVFEHASFILFVGANMLLFVVDGLFREHGPERNPLSDIRIIIPPRLPPPSSTARGCAR